ncbi:MAG: hypothetical protein GY765_01040 [bacterium]|nr:hypothetical protein [bacterium]
MRLKCMRVIVISILLACFVLPATAGTTAPQEQGKKYERLVNLCKIWGKSRFFHPYLAYKNIDWDKALVTILPEVYAAKTDADFVAAVEKMLAVLDDRATCIKKKSKPSDKSAGIKIQPVTKTEDGILVIHINDYRALSDFDAAYGFFQGLHKEMTDCKAIVWDIRSKGTPPDELYPLTELLQYVRLDKRMCKGTVYAPSSRFRMHKGFAPQAGSTSGGYFSTFSVKEAASFTGMPKVEAKPQVFLMNTDSSVPAIALALQAAKQAVIVSEGPLNDNSLAETLSMELTGEHDVNIRFGELISGGVSNAVAADVAFPRSDTFVKESEAYKKALALARTGGKLDKPVSPAVASKPLPVVPQKFPEKSYREMSYPNLNYRTLALFKVWNTFHYFFPYKELMDTDWEEILPTYLAKMENAGNAREYGLVISEMLTHLQDSHVGVYGGGLYEYFGTMFSPVVVRMIEGQPMVTKVLTKAEKGGPLTVGDIVVEVNGEAVEKRIKRYSKYLTVSTPQSLNNKIASHLLRCPKDSKLNLKVKDKNGAVKEIVFALSRAYFRKLWEVREGEVFKLLNKDIGYADLARLGNDQVDKMFETFKSTRAIIFDMRGYPKGTAWSIAPRLTEKNDVVAATFKGIIAWPGRRMDNSSSYYEFRQKLPKTGKWRYKGKTVMLINENAISQAEHTGLFFEAANGTEFIGSATAGANGDVTNFLLPGGLTVYFTGQAVFHADGGQLQRKGLQPHVKVKPTIAGIRAGKDEVLDKAIEYLKEKLH